MQTKIKQSVLCAMGLLALAGTSQAAGLTANVGVTSNYVFRGVTQTNDDPAVQGGVDYLHDTGFYAGVWASNVESATGDKGWETDLYAGYEFKLNDKVKFDVGYITYQYTSTNIPDADEIYFGASFYGVSVTYYDGDVDGGSDYSYVDLKYTLELKDDFKLKFHYGRLDSNGGDAEDALIGITKKINEYELGLTATTVDPDNGNDETEVFISVTRSFDLAF